MNTTQPQINSRVSWFAKGADRTGIVLEIKTSQRRGPKGLRPFIAAGMLPELPATTKAKVMEEGGRQSLWTIPLRMLSVVGKADSSKVEDAYQAASRIKASISNRKFASKDRKAQIVESKGLWDLKPGAIIEVEYRHGEKYEREFVRVTSGYLVEYKQGGHIRRADPQWVHVLSIESKKR